MSIFDQFSSALGGAPSESRSGPMLSGVMSILNNHPGGVAGLAQAFEQNGLGHLMSSWIGTGENLPISADEVKSVLQMIVLLNSRLRPAYLRISPVHTSRNCSPM